MTNMLVESLVKRINFDGIGNPFAVPFALGLKNGKELLFDAVSQIFVEADGVLGIEAENGATTCINEDQIVYFRFHYETGDQ